jgi:hypothetical protein
MDITTTADLERWKLEVEMVETVLRRIERAEAEILRSLGCPVDPVAVYEILAGERPAPWPKKTAKRDVARARAAMFALLHLRDVRHELGVAGGNPRRAVQAALQLGALAGDVVLTQQRATVGAHRLEAKKRASDSAAAVRAEKASQKDDRIRRVAEEYRSRHRYERGQHSTRSLATHIARQLRIPPATVRRRLALLEIR